MRADRLVALLLLLQRRGSVTASEAANELEVSVRTARRDLEALSMAGIPVYSSPGRGGGWQLIGGATTDLSGLSLDETRALFLAAGAGPAATPELASAVAKLTSAVPSPFQTEAAQAAGALRVDSTGWRQIATKGSAANRDPFLNQLIDAVTTRRQVLLDYHSPRSSRRVRLVHPLGLVTKKSIWYLVAAVEDGPRSTASSAVDDDLATRTYRVDRVRGVEVLDEQARRPDGFDLDRAWENIVTEVARIEPRVQLRLRVDPEFVGPLRFVFGSGIDLDPPPSGPAWRTATVRAQSELSLAAQVAGFGNRVQLLDPPPGVVEHLRRIGSELSDLYR